MKAFEYKTEMQELVKTLQTHITENGYLCTNEILKDLGQIYVGDERFKKTSTGMRMVQRSMSARL